MGRKPRKQAVDKTTVYFLESDLQALNFDNRFKALREAKEISLRAVTLEAEIKRSQGLFLAVSLILDCKLFQIENYFRVWGELYDLKNTSPNEFADMIRDTIEFY